MTTIKTGAEIIADYRDGALYKYSLEELIDAELNKVIEQRDMAWAEDAEMRIALNANPEESTADEVRRIVAQRDKLIAVGKLEMARVGDDWLHTIRDLIAEIELSK